MRGRYNYSGRNLYELLLKNRRIKQMGAHAVGCKSTSLRPNYVTMHDSQKSTLEGEEINFI